MTQRIEVRVPDIGNYTDVPVIELLVQPGDSVRRDQGLLTLESDKATMEVPSPADGVVAELAADIHHGEADDIGEGVNLLVPGLFQQLLCRYHPAIGPHQFLEHGKLLARELHRPVAAHHQAAMRIEADAGAVEDRRDGRPRPPRQRLHPGDQLGKGKGLGQVVIGTEPETVDPLRNGGGRREHQDTRLGLRLHQRRTDRVTRKAGDIAVEYEHVIVVDARPFEAGLAVIGDIDRHRMEPQSLGNGVGKLPLILYDQYAHPVHPHQPPIGLASLCRVRAALGQKKDATALRDGRATSILQDQPDWIHAAGTCRQTSWKREIFTALALRAPVPTKSVSLTQA